MKLFGQARFRFHPSVWARLAAVTVGSFLFVPRVVPQPGEQVNPVPRLDTVLRPDGTLNAPPGFTGALDVNGWLLTTGPDQRPRFVRARPPAKQGGSAPGDENWDGRFRGPAGVSGVVRAVAVAPNGDIYVGGDFTMAINSSGSYFTANHVARWDGSGWWALGSGVDNSVYALAIDPQGEVYAGGYFTSAGGRAANH